MINDPQDYKYDPDDYKSNNQQVFNHVSVLFDPTPKKIEYMYIVTNTEQKWHGLQSYMDDFIILYL